MWSGGDVIPTRLIKGEINRSESLALVSMHAELVFDRLITAVDDYGRLDARPSFLKSVLFPMRKEAGATRILGWLQELADITDPPVLLYVVDGRPYLWLTGWEEHRGKAKRAQKSRYPEPPGIPAEKSGDPRGGVPEVSAEIRGYDDGRLTSDAGRLTIDGKVPTGTYSPERSEQRVRAAARLAPALVAFEIPCLGPEPAQITHEQCRRWEGAYPAVDVGGEIKRAIAWIEANPAKRKTAKGVPRFLNAWLSRAQNRGGGGAGGGAPRQARMQQSVEQFIARGKGKS